MERRLPEAVKVIRESDEECLALIATIRARKGETAGIALPSETERLLGNLEARIAERSPAILRELGDARLALAKATEEVIHLSAEVARLNGVIGPIEDERALLRGQLAELGHEFVKLTGEIERLHTECEEKDIVLSCSSLSSPKDAEPEQRVHLTEDCPCGTESCREAWRELRDAADTAKVQQRFTNPPHTAVRQCSRCGEYVGNADPPHRCKQQAKADEEPTEAERRAYESARLDLREGMPNFRDMIREEVAAEVARQLGEQHEAMASPAIRTWLDNVQYELDKLRAALEAED